MGTGKMNVIFITGCKVGGGREAFGEKDERDPQEREM